MKYDKHSKDFKKVVLNYYLKNGSLRKTSELFECSKSSLYDWIVKDLNKDILYQRNVSTKYTKDIENFIVGYVKKNVIPTLKQISTIVKNKYGVSISQTTIHRILHKENITRKRLVKKYFPSKKKDIEKDLLKQFYSSVDKYDYKKIICLDETAIYINMLPEYGRSLSGQKAIRRTHIYPYKKFNLIVAMKYNKVIGYELSKESYDTNKLVHFIDKTLNKYKNHLLIFDNAVFHKSKKVLSILEKHNIQHLYIVPYHPENNPIEKLFSQLKSYLKIANCQSYDEIYEEIDAIIKTKITINNLTNYIKTIY